jgi:hypothetical protein
MGKDSSVARDVDQRGRHERVPRPGEDIPKDGAQVLAVCATPGQLDDCVALALQ